MTDKKCLGIDCAWCASTECPNEKKEKEEIDREMIANAFMKAYNKHFKESGPWNKN